MKYHGIEMQGPFISEIVSEKPAHTSAERGRIYYDETTDEFYFRKKDYDDNLSGNTADYFYLSFYDDFETAIDTISALGKSLIIDQPVDLGGATVDCLGVGLVWLSEGNIISNGTVNISGCHITAGRFKIFDGVTLLGTPDLTPVEEFETANKSYVDSKFLDTSLGSSINELTTSLANIPQQGLLKFLSLLLAGKVTKIKLIGDSVTAGARSAGYVIPADGRVILTGSRFNDGGAGYAREAGTNWTTFPSWANLFRKYINTNYPTIDFFNAGIGGLSTSESVSDYLSQLITDNEDVLFIMLGMNDRTGTLVDYKANMTTMLNYAKTRSNLIILMSPPPSTSEFIDNDPTKTFKEGYNFGSREIDNTLRALSKEYKIPYISHYIASSSYMSNANVKYLSQYSLSFDADGICDDYTHPSTLGYSVIWQTIQKDLGFLSDVLEWFKQDKLDGVHYNNLGILTNDVSSFNKGVTLGIITNSEGSSGGFPHSKGGLVVTFKQLLSNNPYLKQVFFPYDINKMYTRYWMDSAWSDWSYWPIVISTRSGGVTDTTLLTDSAFKSEAIQYNYIVSGNAGFPESKAGLLFTIKLPESFLVGYAYQDFHVYNTVKIYRRYWNGSGWGVWNKITGIKQIIATDITTLSPPSSYFNDISYALIGSNHTDIANFPEGMPGTLLTYYFSALYTYQEYTVYGSINTYKRYWTDSAWSEWAKISANA